MADFVAVLDASAMMAYLGDEPGADVVGDTIANGAVISTVNLAEILSQQAQRGGEPAQLVAKLRELGVLDGALTVEPFTAEDAIEVGRLRPLTKSAGLSLGDRACLALARRLSVQAMTADHEWLRLRLEVDVYAIRDRRPS